MLEAKLSTLEGAIQESTQQDERIKRLDDLIRQSEDVRERRKNRLDERAHYNKSTESLMQPLNEIKGIAQSMNKQHERI